MNKIQQWKRKVTRQFEDIRAILRHGDHNVINSKGVDEPPILFATKTGRNWNYF